MAFFNAAQILLVFSLVLLAVLPQAPAHNMDRLSRLKSVMSPKVLYFVVCFM